MTSIKISYRFFSSRFVHCYIIGTLNSCYYSLFHNRDGQKVQRKKKFPFCIYLISQHRMNMRHGSILCQIQSLRPLGNAKLILTNSYLPVFLFTDFMWNNPTKHNFKQTAKFVYSCKYLFIANIMFSSPQNLYSTVSQNHNTW